MKKHASLVGSTGTYAQSNAMRSSTTLWIANSIALLVVSHAVAAAPVLDLKVEPEEIGLGEPAYFYILASNPSSEIAISTLKRSSGKISKFPIERRPKTNGIRSSSYRTVLTTHM